TNGAVNRLREIGPLERIDFCVSIDGWRPFHDWHRGAGTYDRTVAFCREAIDRGCKSLEVRCLLTRDNIRHLDEFHQDLVDRLGTNNFTHEFTCPYTNGHLHSVREVAPAINRHDIEDDRTMTAADARQILADTYQGRYTLYDNHGMLKQHLCLSTY